MQAQGKAYVPPRKTSKPKDASAAGSGAQAGGDKDRKGRTYKGDKEPGWRPFEQVEVIVLPIYWNSDKEEKASVLKAAEKARGVLAAAGLQVDLDASNKYTPGKGRRGLTAATFLALTFWGTGLAACSSVRRASGPAVRTTCGCRGRASRHRMRCAVSWRLCPVSFSAAAHTPLCRPWLGRAGQKMKYWETMGVRVRVELGPRDVANGNCTIALATKTPGASHSGRHWVFGMCCPECSDGLRQEVPRVVGGCLPQQLLLLP